MQKLFYCARQQKDTISASTLYKYFNKVLEGIKKIKTYISIQ